MEVEDCEMHQGDKITARAFGFLEKSRNKVPIDSFPGGIALVKKSSSCAAHFHYSERWSKLLHCCHVAGCAETIPNLDLNSTRMLAKHLLLYDTLRIEKGRSVPKLDGVDVGGIRSMR